MSRVGCERSSEKFPAAAMTETPRSIANLIARCSATQIARCVGSFRQLNNQGSAK
jgi:hypothetical protein